MTESSAQHTNEMDKGRYAEVHGLKIYYEIQGEGFPLVLLHGGLSAIGTSFGRVLPTLSKGRQIIAIEQQAHGRTADIDRPLTYRQMASDTVALLLQIGITQADFFGYSIGAGVAIDIAIEHPTIVRKLVLATPIATAAGFQTGVLAGMEALRPEHLAGSPFQEEYAQLAPRPQDWPQLIARVQQLNREFVDLSPEAIASIKAPALLIAGDDDIVRLEHMLELFQLLGGGPSSDPTRFPHVQLAILPGTSHIALVERVDWLVPMVTAFLDAPRSA